jgi:hypothetical protein
MSDADQIRRNAKWSKSLLGRALAGEPENTNNYLPPPEGPEEIARYKQLQESADAIVAIVDEGKALPYDLVLEYGFLHHINVGWGLGVQNKFFRNQGNKDRHAKAGPDLLAALAHWRKDHPGLSAADAVGQFIDEHDVDDPDKKPQFTKNGLPKARDSMFGGQKQRRLRKLLRDGLVPPK